VLEITPDLQIDDVELHFDFIRSSGPGGQNVNKVATAAQLRFDVIHSPSLPLEVKERLARLAGSRMTDQGVLIIDARAYRTQEQNKADAIRRLAALVLKAAEAPKERKRVRPSGAGRARDKQRRSEIKRIRREGPEEWE
jgi:ribosome-associated protein